MHIIYSLQWGSFIAYSSSSPPSTSASGVLLVLELCGVPVDPVESCEMEGRLGGVRSPSSRSRGGVDGVEPCDE